MRLIKILSAALLSCAAFVSVNTNAQQVPAPCSWETTGTTTTSQQQTTVQVCKESSGLRIATRTLVFSAPYTSPPTCTLSMFTNVSNPSGDCLSPSFVKSIPLVCNTGAYIGDGCVESMSSSPVFGAGVQLACGNGCQVRFEFPGGSSSCSRNSPYAKAYCK